VVYVRRKLRVTKPSSDANETTARPQSKFAVPVPITTFLRDPPPQTRARARSAASGPDVQDERCLRGRRVGNTGLVIDECAGVDFKGIIA
jgi:hypothetical protein